MKVDCIPVILRPRGETSRAQCISNMTYNENVVEMWRDSKCEKHRPRPVGSPVGREWGGEEKR